LTPSPYRSEALELWSASHNNDPEPKNAFLGPKKLEIFSTKKN